MGFTGKQADQSLGLTGKWADWSMGLTGKQADYAVGRKIPINFLSKHIILVYLTLFNFCKFLCWLVIPVDANPEQLYAQRLMLAMQ